MRTIQVVLLICAACLFCACSKDEDEKFEPLSEEEFQEVSGNLKSAVCTVQPIFYKCNSTEEIEQYLDEIRQTDGVEDAWTDAFTLFVKVKGYGTLYFLYPPEEREIPLDDEMGAFSRHLATGAADGEQQTHHQTEAKCARILFQQSKDLTPSRSFKAKLTKRVEKAFKNVGIEDTEVITEPSVECFRQGLANCDAIFLMTHGVFDEEKNLHWLLTSDEVLVVNRDLTEDEAKEELKIQKAFVDTIHHAPEEISAGFVKEIRRVGGRSQTVTVFYKMISEKFIDNQMAPFANDGHVIVYSTACQSMKSARVGTSISLSEAFLRRGAACYLGWNESNGVGDSAGECFFKYLLSGRSVVSAKKMMRSEFTYDVFRGVPSTLEMNLSYNDSDDQYCLLHPETLGLSIDNTQPGFPYVLYGRSMAAWPDQKIVYGIVVSENEDMSNPVDKCEKYCTVSGKDCQYSNKEHSVTIRWSPDQTKLEPNKTYFYCAYLDDGDGICYGEPKELVAAPLNERALFDVHGPVESVKLVTNWGTTTRSFNENGMWISYNGQSVSSIYRYGIERDNAGRMISAQFDEDSGTEFWQYDKYGRIYSYGIMEYDSGETDTYYYGDNGLVAYMTVEMGGMDVYWNDNYRVTYYNYVLDEYKNWVSRTAYYSTNEVYNETRTITYFDNNMEFYR